jgi:hypothetical protein
MDAPEQRKMNLEIVSLLSHFGPIGGWDFWKYFIINDIAGGGTHTTSRWNELLEAAAYSRRPLS